MEDIAKYKEHRASFQSKWQGRELFEYIDQWPLYVGTRNLARFLYIADSFRSVLDVPGDVAEFGSWRGSNVMLLAKLLEILCPHSPKRVHCFEGFEGLTTFVEQDGASTAFRGQYKGNYEELRDAIELYGLSRRVEIHPGLIQNTVQKFAAASPEKRFSFVYYDADLYEPARIVLETFYERLSVGGLMIFDEWNDDRFPGETRAVTEFFEHRNDYRMWSGSFTLQPSLVVQKTLPQGGK